MIFGQNTFWHTNRFLGTINPAVEALPLAPSRPSCLILLISCNLTILASLSILYTSNIREFYKSHIKCGMYPGPVTNSVCQVAYLELGWKGALLACWPCRRGLSEATRRRRLHDGDRNVVEVGALHRKTKFYKCESFIFMPTAELERKRRSRSIQQPKMGFKYYLRGKINLHRTLS